MKQERRQGPDRTSPTPSTELYALPTRFRSEDRAILGWSIAAAILLHLVLFLVHLPDRPDVVVADPGPTLDVTWHRIKPPTIERREVALLDNPRMVPVPDPDPDDPEPVREAALDIEPDPLPFDPGDLFGDPEPPPPAGPRIPGSAGVTNPVLIASTKVAPHYPEIARVARVPAVVTLQAVITKDGSVDDVRVLTVDHPNLGFEWAAIEAVRQWRYEPATSNGRPVDVYFTIRVSFTLL